ncbi:MAG: dephospho-CoA kinase [Thermoguttaceae bacterium]|nr:dephospho-CoA kinase [Thermoguttaceae bacterium]
MKVIGIVGGIASGKSFYTDIFESQGAVTFKADEVAHDVLNERTIKEKIRQRWGEEIINDNGTVNRPKLAQIVFQGTEDSDMERLYLESLIYPPLKKRFERFLDECESNDVYYIILDAALLLEANWDKMCDAIVFIDTPEEVRLERAKTTRGWTETEFRAREASQFSIKKKKKRCQFTLDGLAKKDDAVKAVEELLKQI